MWGWTGWRWNCLHAQFSHLITDSNRGRDEQKGRGHGGEHIGQEPSHLLPSSHQTEVEDVCRTQLLLLGSSPSSWALEWSCPIKYGLGSLQREKSENEPWPFLNARRMLSQTWISLLVEIRDSGCQGKKQNSQPFEKNSHIFQRKHETKTAHREVNKS